MPLRLVWILNMFCLHIYIAELQLLSVCLSVSRVGRIGMLNPTQVSKMFYTS